MWTTHDIDLIAGISVATLARLMWFPVDLAAPVWPGLENNWWFGIGNNDCNQWQLTTIYIYICIFVWTIGSWSIGLNIYIYIWFVVLNMVEQLTHIWNHRAATGYISDWLSSNYSYKACTRQPMIWSLCGDKRTLVTNECFWTSSEGPPFHQISGPHPNISKLPTWISWMVLGSPIWKKHPFVCLVEYNIACLVEYNGFVKNGRYL